MKFNEFLRNPRNSRAWIGILAEIKEFYEIQWISKKSYEFQGLNWNMRGNKEILRNLKNFNEILGIPGIELEYGRKYMNSMKFNEFLGNPRNSRAWIGILAEIN